MPVARFPGPGEHSHMIRHVVLFKFKEEFPQESRDEWADQARRLPELIPAIKAFTLGFDVLHSERSWDASIVADFDTIEDVQAYAVHPSHLPVAALSVPNCDQMVSVDFELTETR